MIQAKATPSSRRPWWPWLAAAAVLALWLYPLALGNDLRLKADQRLLDQGWQPENRIMPALGRAHARSLDAGGRLPAAELDALWSELEAYRGTHPEFFWLELAWLEGRAGRWARGRAALARATAADPRIVDMARGPAWDGLRPRLGLGP